MSFVKYNTILINNKPYSKADIQAINEKGNTDPHLDQCLEFMLEWLNDETGVTVHTSGSTGSPAPIQISKDAMVQSALATGKYFNLKPNDKALLCLPCKFIAGKMMVVRSFVLGLNLITVTPSGTPLETADGSIDFAAMTPMQLTATLREHPEKLNEIKTLIIGGGVVNSELIKQLEEIPTNCFATYGMTETITHIAIKALNGPQASKHYHALEKVTFKEDERGCLVIQAEHLDIDALVTNDRVKLINDQTFEWLGRVDHVINSGGLKIQPEEVEAKLEPIIQRPFFVAGIDDEEFGQKVALFMEGKAWKPEEITDFYRKSGLVLEKHQIPKAFFFVKSFSQTGTGKIQRRATISRLGLLNK